jgi:hypothetical protein
MRLPIQKILTTLTLFASFPLALGKINNEGRLVSQEQQHYGLHDSDSSPDTAFLVTAVLNSKSPPYHAIIECWALSTPFKTYPTVGKALALGDTSNATYVVLPPNSGEGWHRPPANM